MSILHVISLGIGIAGTAVIIWGALLALLELIKLEGERFKGVDICARRHDLRHHFGSYLLLGLEFLIAADIINTIVSPTLEEVGILGAIVVIRTVINLSLNKEMTDVHSDHQI